jgi:hypothetical protein
MEYQKLEGHGPLDAYGKAFIYLSKWGWQQAEILRQCLAALSSHRFPMGGSRHVAIGGTGVHEAWEYDDYEPQFIGFLSTTFRAELKSDNTGTQVRAVLKDVTANTTLFTSSWINAAVWTRVEHLLPKTTELIAGHVYRAYFEKDNDNAGAYGKAWMDRL